MIHNFFFTIAQGMTKGNFSFAILVVGFLNLLICTLQLIVMRINLKILRKQYQEIKNEKDK